MIGFKIESKIMKNSKNITFSHVSIFSGRKKKRKVHMCMREMESGKVNLGVVLREIIAEARDGG